MGSLLRYGISVWLASQSLRFPMGTLVANVLACLVLGTATAYFLQKTDISPTYQAMVLTGFCGGFSTFSTFSLETFRLIENGQLMMAMLYVVLSVLLCLGVLWVIYKMNYQGLG